MELFNIYNNLIMRSIPFIVNELVEKKEIDKYRLANIFLDSIGITDSCTKLTEDKYVEKNIFNPTDESAFIAKDEKKYHLLEHPVFVPLPVIFSKHEKEYIKLMLEDSEARAFMDEELVRKLENALCSYDVSYITENYVQRDAVLREINASELRSRIITISDALRKSKKIKYIYSSKNGEYEGTASPYKLMYSLRERILRLAACPDSSPERFILMNLDRFVYVELTDIDADAEPEKFYSSQSRRLILNIENDKSRKSAERCMRIFGSYRRRTFYNKDNDTFTLEIDFYLFDKESIIKDILSLGSAAQIIEVRKPGNKKDEYIKDDNIDLRGEIIERLKAMYNNMA